MNFFPNFPEDDDLDMFSDCSIEELLVNTSQYRLSTGNSLWVIRFDPANLPGNDILEGISGNYFKGEVVIAAPNEDDLVNIGLKKRA